MHVYIDKTCDHEMQAVLTSCTYNPTLEPEVLFDFLNQNFHGFDSQCAGNL